MKSQIKYNKNEQFHCYIMATVRPSVRLFMFFSRQNNWKFEKRITKKDKIHTPTNPNLIRSAQEFKWNIWTGEFERKKSVIKSHEKIWVMSTVFGPMEKKIHRCPVRRPQTYQ